MSAIGEQSLSVIARELDVLTADGELDAALVLVHDSVEDIISEPLCTSQVFGSRVLDIACQLIGQRNLQSIPRRWEPVAATSPDHPIIAYLVTKLQDSGGHTHVIKDFIRAQPDAKHLLMSTEIDGRSDASHVLSELKTQHTVMFEAAPGGGYRERLTWLQTRLLETRPQMTYLFNHHQDSIAVAALQPEMGLRAAFYHHGDHHLCLGVCLPHIDHIDPHPMGYHNCRDELGVENLYVPLTVEDRGDRPQALGFRSDGVLTTCTAARSNKVEIPYIVSYVDFIPALLKATGGKHVHIGRLTLWALRAIRRGLQHHGIEQGRFTYVSWVPSVWKALHDYHVDLYVASFPYGGGLTLIEAMGSGTPVALHHHIYSRVLSSAGLAYPGAFSWQAPDDLINYCVGVSAADLACSGSLARAHYLSNHQQSILTAYLAGTQDVSAVPCPAQEPFQVRRDEFAFWIERQVSIRHVLSKRLYRMAKKIRARWSRILD